MDVERADQAFDRIVPKGATLELVADGFRFTEGPVWDHPNRCLYFSDIPNSRIHRWSHDDGLSVHREPSYKANGLTLDPQGRLLACEHVGRRISRQEPDGTLVPLARNYDGNRLNSPNDIVAKSDGSIYFTDPPFGLYDGIGALAPREIDFNGVYHISPDGIVSLATDEFGAPNGLCFSPDESVLYIDDTFEKAIRAYDVQPDGSLANGRLFARTEGTEEGAPDGMKVDVEGNVYCTGPGGIHVFDDTGKFLGRMMVPTGGVKNFAFGDDDWQTVYICNTHVANSTATGYLHRVRLGIPGMPIGPH